MKPGENLRRLRIEAGHTLASLAAATGIAEGTLNAWEINPDRLKYRNADHREQVRRIVKALNEHGYSFSEADVWGLAERATAAHSKEGSIDPGFVADMALFLTGVGFAPDQPDNLSEEARELLSRLSQFK